MLNPENSRLITFACFLILHQLEAVGAATVESTVKVRANVIATTLGRVALVDICNGTLNAVMLHQ